jgi:hypothetical protein
MRNLSLAIAVATLMAAPIVAQTVNKNPVFRSNRTFTRNTMGITNPPEYYTTGQTVPAGTMTWKVFPDQTNRRREDREVTGFEFWMQPSDELGTWPQTLNTPEVKVFPTTVDGAGLAIPDFTQPALVTVPPASVTYQTWSWFKYISYSLSTPAVIPAANAEIAVATVYQTGANHSLPGFFGHLPSAVNTTDYLPQAFWGYAYANGTIVHGDVNNDNRPSILYYENKPTINVRSSWGLIESHFTAGHQTGAWGEQNYFAPLADPNWAGWSETRGQPTTIWIDIRAQNQDGDFPIILMNFGAEFKGGINFLGETLELLIADPMLGVLAPLAAPIAQGKYEITVPLFSNALPFLTGSYMGFEAVLIDQVALATNGTTQSVWIYIP